MDYEDAIAEIGAIRKELKAQTSPDKETTKTDHTKAPGRVAARGTPPDSLTAQRQAADKNDYRAWKQSYDASRAKAK